MSFKKDAKIGGDRSRAFCCLWFKDIPDDEECTLTLPVRLNEHGALRRARANASDIGEKVGEITLTLRFHPGMSGFHHAATKHDANLRDVADVLDCAESSREISSEQVDPAHDHVYGSSSGSADSSDSEHEKVRRQDSGKRNVIDEVKDFKDRKDALHRKHRGLMQWKGVRQLAWAKDEVKEKAEEVRDKVKLRQRDGGVDTEV